MKSSRVIRATRPEVLLSEFQRIRTLCGYGSDMRNICQVFLDAFFGTAMPEKLANCVFHDYMWQVFLGAVVAFNVRRHTIILN